MKTKFNQFINENILVFHGSQTKFDRFDINKIGSGDGKSKGGWGLYFSTSEEVANGYKTSSGFVKEFEIKDGKYFDLDEPMDVGLAHEIVDKLRYKNISETELEEFETDYIDYSYDINNKQIYDWLSYVLGSEKEASLFLKDMGFIGNKFQDKWNSEATNYVLFDTKFIYYV